ncbi:hypothetical protein [Caldisalinibacter kiritimatiensis]|nr:hypothetical protein [Caldisalinibacter kiritimatiensis]
MELVCPLCNGLYEHYVSCPSCGKQMTDQGPLVDYYDEYSPYLSNDTTQLVDGVSHEKCVHVFKCTSCNRDKRIQIERVRM